MTKAEHPVENLYPVLLVRRNGGSQPASILDFLCRSGFPKAKQCSSQTRWFIRQSSKALSSRGTIQFDTSWFVNIWWLKNHVPSNLMVFYCFKKQTVWDILQSRSLEWVEWFVTQSPATDGLMAAEPTAQQTFLQPPPAFTVVALANVRESKMVWIYSECCVHVHPPNASIPINRYAKLCRWTCFTITSYSLSPHWIQRILNICSLNQTLPWNRASHHASHLLRSRHVTSRRVIQFF